MNNLKEFADKLKESITYEIEMAIQSGYINDNLFYPFKDLCHDPIIKTLKEFEGEE